MNSKPNKPFTRIWSLLLVAALLAAYLPMGGNKAEAADAAPAGSDRVVITAVTSAEGFTHPGIGLTKEILENARAQVIAKQEPWYSYYVAMSQSGYASSAFSANIFASANGDGTDNPKKRSVNSKGEFVADGLRAYTQALMYYFTGEESYRSNAMRIIRLWSQMDPAQYSYFTDSHIHMGVPLNRMVTAAEILRYSGAPGEDSAWAWTEADTAHFSGNLITPMIETFCHFNDKFMNQHLYPLLGGVSGYIFTDNAARYAEGVEWFTVNATAPDQGQNGSIKRLFRLVTHNENTGEPLDTPRVQHVEMGRDQAHGAGDLTNSEILARLLEAQGTKVDPEKGTISTAGKAVTAYAFLGNRLLAASDYFARFMLGHDTPWTPVIARYDNGKPVIYHILAEGYRGRIGGNVYGQYYYYKYNMGLDLEKEAPYYADMFRKRHYFWWESPDAGADYWMFIPAEAAGEGVSTLPKVSPAGLNEVEYRTTADLNGGQHASILTDADGTSYVRMTAAEEGSRVALVASGTSSKSVALRIRTNGTARLEINGWKDDVLVLPDTKGQWTYVTFAMNEIQGLSELVYLKLTGNGTVADIDHILLDAAAQLTPPAFAAGKGDVSLFAYAGSQAALQAEFPAVDPGKNDTVTYQIESKPDGALFDESSGSFSWRPEQPGTYRFIVSAADGTTVTAKQVTVTVARDRRSAMEAVVASYDPAQAYILATLEAYQGAYQDTLRVLDSAPDVEVYRALSGLYSAVQGLRLLTPLLSDGSMDYTKMGVVSTFGTQIYQLVDGSPDSFAGYYLTGDRSYIMDFGADYKISAELVKLQVRAGFPERIGGAAVYGSNDKESWTRLTPGRAEAVDDLQSLEVSGELRNQQYRFLKLDMNHNPTSTMFELSEVRIYGQRHETYNKLQSVSISSPQSVQSRVGTGDMVSVSFTSVEPIQDVRVSIQGRQAAVLSADGKSWTAFVPMDSAMPTGKVRFTIDYKTLNGTAPDTVIFTTDNSSLYYVNKTYFLDITKLAAVTASSAGYGSGGLPAGQVGYLLFDGNLATAGDLAAGTGAFYTIDFGEEAAVRLTGAILMPRSGQAARMNGVVLQGSADNGVWTDLTPAIAGAADNTWTYMSADQIKDSGACRYIRIFNSGAWYGNIAEVELYGEYDIPGIQSKVAGPEGYTRLSYSLYKQEADIIVEAFNQPGANKLDLLNRLMEAGKLLVPLSSLPANKLELAPAMVTASTVPWVPAGQTSSETAAQNGWRAFDGNVGTYTDATGNPSWIMIDLGEGKERALGSFRFYPRNPNANHIARVNGAILQGSLNGMDFADLYTISGISTAQWHSADIADGTPFRFLRYYSPNNGGANVAELEFCERVIDKTLLAYLVEQADALNTGLYTETSLLPFQEALAAAREASSGGGYTQEQIDQAADRLQTAQGGLVYKTGVPLIAPLPDLTVDAGTPVSFTVKTLNNMSGTVFSADALPAGADLNPSTGGFAWTPAKEQGGVYSLVFTATAGGYSTSATVRLTVKGAPQLEPAAHAELTARQVYSYKVPAVDPSGQALVYQAGSLPKGASFSPATGIFTWTPEQADYGSHTVSFTVSNMKYSASQTLSLNVGLHLLPAGDYTKGSYYVYRKEADRIAAAIAKPGADKPLLLSELAAAEGGLVYNLHAASALYPFDGNLEDSLGAAAGTAFGSPAYTQGKKGRALQLSGANNQYVQLPAGLALAKSDEMTVAAWVYWEANSQWQRIFDFGASTTQYMFLTPRSGNNTLRFVIKNGGAEQVVNTDQLPLNQWVHVAVTLGGGSAKLFVNGAEKASAAVTIQPGDVKPELNYIGKSQFAADPLFAGKLDELVLYTRALSAEEMALLYGGNMMWRDDSLLELLLEEAAALDPQLYTADSRAALQAAVAAAQEQLASAAGSQQQTDEAAGGLLQVLNRLERIPYMESLTPVEVWTVVGVPPELPGVVDAVYSNKTVVTVPVVWSPIDPVLYSVPCSFTVTGAVYGTPLAAEARVTVTDPEAPPPPANLSASGITDTSLTLGWTASTGIASLAGYEVLRDGRLAGTVSAATYSYAFTGLTPDTAYTFQVAAFDGAGNRAVSSGYTARTLPAEDRTPPGAPAGLAAASVTASSLVLGWLPSADNVAVAGYEVFRDGQSAGTVSAATYSYAFTGLTSDTGYTFRVAAFDGAGNRAVSGEFIARTASASSSSTGGWSGSAGSLPGTGAEPVVTGARIQAALTVKDGTAQTALDAASLNKAIANAALAKDNALLIELESDDPVSAVSLELPAEAWIKAGLAGVKEVSVRSALGSLKLPTDAIAGLSGQEKLLLTFKSADDSERPVSLAAALTGKPVLELGLAVDGKPVVALAAGKKAQVRIPYARQTGESRHSLVGAAVNAAGLLQPIRNSSYEAGAGEVVLSAGQLGAYGVLYKPSAFTDLGDYAWARDSVDALFARGITDGLSTDRFAPGLAVTRGEFLKLAMEALELVQNGKTSSFTDVKAGAWYSDAIATAQALGIVDGYEDGSFGLDRAITREEMAVLVMRLLTAAGVELPKTSEATGFRDASRIAGYAADAVMALNEAGMMEGQGAGLFAPQSPTLRAEAAVLMARIMGLE